MLKFKSDLRTVRTELQVCLQPVGARGSNADRKAGGRDAESIGVESRSVLPVTIAT